MPPKRRPPLIASLTGDREAKKQEFLTALQKAERRCRQATKKVSQAESQEQAGGYRTRSKGPKKLYQLSVKDCIECNQRSLEAFDEEYNDVIRKTIPLLCTHGKVIDQVVCHGEDQIHPFPPIQIPALTCETRIGPPVVTVSVTSSGGSVNADKLQEVKSGHERTYEELLGAHKQLSKAVAEVEADEIIGYDDLYSEAALE